MAEGDARFRRAGTAPTGLRRRGAQCAPNGGVGPTGRRCARTSWAGMRPARPHCAQEGALRPLLRITPAGGCSRVPATANKFVHILWKNLICDNVAEARFHARPRGRECWRCEALACCFREGDAPAGCRYAGAGCAPLQGDAAFSAPKSWPRSVWRAEVVAPYEVAAVNGTRASGVAAIPLTLTRQMGGSRKASLTLARAARPEGRGGDSQEAGGTLVPPPLVCLRRTAANMPS